MKNSFKKSTLLVSLFAAMSFPTYVSAMPDKAPIAAGADGNAVNSNGRTALMRAVINGHLDIVRKLIADGDNGNAVDNWNRTALIHAAENDYYDIVALLQEAANQAVIG